MDDRISIGRRRVLAVCGLAAASPFAARLARAQNADAARYPDHLVRVVNPWTPGGPGDAVGRPIVDLLTRAWKQPVIMENHPGANAVIGSAFVAKAAPDGYTLLLGQTGPNTISPSLGKGTPYDPVKDFAPITQVTSAPLALAVRPDLPIRSVAELIAYAQAHPRALSFGSVGNGSTGHIAGELLRSMAHIDLLHVPYRGAAPALTDLMGGQLSMIFLNIAGILPFAGSGRIRPIGVSTLKRSSFMPDVPAIAETLPRSEMTSWYSLMAPAGTPAPIVEKIYRTVDAGMRTPEMAAIFRSIGQELELSSPEQFAITLRSDIVKWRQLIKDSNVTGE